MFTVLLARHWDFGRIFYATGKVYSEAFAWRSSKWCLRGRCQDRLPPLIWWVQRLPSWTYRSEGYPVGPHIIRFPLPLLHSMSFELTDSSLAVLRCLLLNLFSFSLFGRGRASRSWLINWSISFYYTSNQSWCHCIAQGCPITVDVLRVRWVVRVLFNR